MVANCITVRGSFAGTSQDMEESLAFAAGDEVKADIELQLLSVAQAFEAIVALIKSMGNTVAAKIRLYFSIIMQRATCRVSV
jgi:D-arabinose 1-dehydrogenase-like Zn-dependent alcohol dehydrogenase